MNILKSVFIFWMALSCFAMPLRAEVKGFDHSLWDAFLKKYVNENGEVDYRAVQKDPAMLDAYFDFFSKEKLIEFEAFWPREEQIAFWLNVYNAAVIKLITQHYPVSSIQKIPSVWDITIVRLGRGEQFSLNGIRSEQLMKKYRDEKIHLALSCGARGCPKLQRDAFTGKNVEGQLFLATRSFLSDPKNLEIVPGKKNIWLSRIFKWYAADFNLDFGTPETIGKFTQDEMSVLSFLAYYLEREEQIAFLEEGKYKIKYYSFDWRLNDWTGNISSEIRPPEEGAALPQALVPAAPDKKS